MLYKLWEIIQMWLPYWVVIQLYKSKKAVPANIQTRSGKILRATMVTPKYGIIFTNQDYISNRGKLLQQKRDEINKANELLTKEINSLSFAAREELFAKKEDKQ